MKQTLKLIRIDNGMGILAGNGFKVAWPVEFLPEGLHAGQELVFSIESGEEARTGEARSLLNELLKINEE